MKTYERLPEIPDPMQEKYDQLSSYVGLGWREFVFEYSVDGSVKTCKGRVSSLKRGSPIGESVVTVRANRMRNSNGIELQLDTILTFRDKKTERKPEWLAQKAFQSHDCDEMPVSVLPITEYPKPDDTYRLRDRTALVYVDQPQPDLNDIINIEGDLFRVIGIETHAVLNRDELRKFTLLVEPLFTMSN